MPHAIAHAGRQPQAAQRRAPMPQPARAPRTLAPRAHCACGGGCPRCGSSSARQPLSIGPADDHFEREADRLAQRLAAADRSSAAPAVSPLPARVSRKPAAAGNAAAGVAPEAVETALQEPGQPLDAAQRAWFEPRLGRDLGAVRLHRGGRAAAAAQAVSARAYTVGSDIVLGADAAPTTAAGRELLAHELVHVLQQGGVAARTLQRSVVENPAPGAGEGGQQLPSGPAPQPEAGAAAAASVAPETCPPPAEMACTPNGDVPATSHEFVFTAGSATLSAAQKIQINGIAAGWHAGGAGASFRVDGYASAEGDCGFNWLLSCRRAEAVRNALLVPSDGTPGVAAASVINPFAHGESDAAGAALAPNRRATLSQLLGPDPEPDPEPETPATCTLPVLLGSARGCGGGTDFTHFDFPATSTWEEAKFAAWAAAMPGSLLPRTSRWDISDAECEVDMAGTLSLLAGGAGLAAFRHFKTGSGSTVSHTPGDVLADDALASDSFQATKDAVRADIESQLAAQAASGTLDACALSVTPPATHFGFGDSVALKAVIGGTQGEELYCTAFSGDAALRSYAITLRFEICDDFGVDNADLYGPGLFGFWVLQHERSASRYAPFVNRLELPVTLSGTF